jgi:hypothetical protein
MVTALVHLDAKDLAFTKSADGHLRTTLDLLSVTFGPEGKVESQNAKGFEMSVADEAELARVRKNGVVYTVYHPVKIPGGFQMRVGLRERGSLKTGTASQFIEIPKPKRAGLMLSSLLVQATSAEAKILGGPAVRRFLPKEQLVWAARILNAKRGKDRQPRLTHRLVLYRDGKVLHESPDEPWNQKEIDDPERLPILGMIQLGDAMPPGDYVLQLVVTDQLETNENKRTATQAMDFEVVATRG